MDAARREKREHGTKAFPFQIYPALDGSEADDSDFIPYHWHPEPEIITVDAGRVSLAIADHVYEGEHGDVFFAEGEELHEIRTAGWENQFRSFVFAADFLQFTRADQVETKLLAPLAEGRLRLETSLRAGENGQRGYARCWKILCVPVWVKRQDSSLRSRRRCSVLWRCARRRDCLAADERGRERIIRRGSSRKLWDIWVSISQSRCR